LKSQVEELEAELIQVTKAKEEQTAALSALEESLKQQEVQKAEIEEKLGQLTEAAQQAAEEAKRVEDLSQQKTELEEALAKAAETTQIELARVQSAKDEAEKGEAELTKLTANIASLEEEEKRLSGLVGVQRNDLHAAGVALEALRQKQSQMETQVLEFTRSGGELLSVGEALLAMTARKDETQKSLKAAAEKELELQVRLGALQEAVTRETSRVETVVKERAKMEAEFQAFMEKAQAEAQKLREERTVLTKAVEALKGQQAAFAEAEAQMKQWEQIEQRLRGQLEELEEKHEVMRVGLAVDESTVLMFANDLIKRLDLIDALRKRYAGMASGDVAEQLYTLRASVEDVLLQHGIVEFDVEPGTVVDVDLRKRITVVDAVAGKERARVVETFRTGFLRVMNDGDERILRKVEVRTSSQG
jgi:molecular chaperone GrpE (heat shock protein)